MILRVSICIIIIKWDRPNEGKRKNVGNCCYICLYYIEFIDVDTANYIVNQLRNVHSCTPTCVCLEKFVECALSRGDRDSQWGFNFSVLHWLLLFYFFNFSHFLIFFAFVLSLFLHQRKIIKRMMTRLIYLPQFHSRKISRYF